MNDTVRNILENERKHIENQILALMRRRSEVNAQIDKIEEEMSELEDRAADIAQHICDDIIASRRKDECASVRVF